MLLAALLLAIQGSDGRVGVCAGTVCVNPHERFSLQSVMKLPMAMAVMDAVDHREWRLDESVTLFKRDRSVFVQPIADLITDNGYRTTIGDLVRRAIVDSDSAATDFLIARLGGPPAVQSFLRRKGIAGIRVDRDERHLQTEILGLRWRPEFADPAALDSAIERVPRERRDAAYRRYQADVRDTATPEAMSALLQTLADGKLLSAASTAYLLDVMSQTATFPDRLKAGLQPGWTIAHKTGTSGSWNGVTAATNDVGILRAPDGRSVPIVVFIADSRAPAADRAALMAKLAALTIAQY